MTVKVIVPTRQHPLRRLIIGILAVVATLAALLANAAVPASATSAPGRPTITAATRSGTTATVTWTPGNANGSTPTGWQIETCDASADYWATCSTASNWRPANLGGVTLAASVRTATLQSMTGVTYYVHIRQTAVIGTTEADSTWSLIRTPAPPGWLTTQPHDRSILFWFEGTSSDGFPADTQRIRVEVCQSVTVCSANSSNWVLPPSTTPTADSNGTVAANANAAAGDPHRANLITINGLTNNIQYWVRARVINTFDKSAWTVSGSYRTPEPAGWHADYNHVDPDATDGQYYLGLGDSLGGGYNNWEWRHAKEHRPGIGLQSFSCGGEDSSGMLGLITSVAWSLNCTNPSDGGWSPQVVGTSSQMDAAEKFIAAHPGKVAFISVSIGGNDPDDGIPFGTTRANIATVIARLKQALINAGDISSMSDTSVPIVGSDDPNSGGIWKYVIYNMSTHRWQISSAADQQAAQTAVSGWKGWNDQLDSWFTGGGAFASADIPAAFSSYVPFSQTDSWQPPQIDSGYPQQPLVVPVAVKRTCELTPQCKDHATNRGGSTNPHPNDPGYDVMGQALGTATGATFLHKNATSPAAPSVTSVSAGNAQATVNWTPGSDGGSAVTSTEVQQCVAGSADGSTPRCDASGGWAPTVNQQDGNSATITNLDNGTAYWFRVRQVNAIDAGAWTDTSATVTPSTVPGAPTGLLAATADHSLSVSWTKGLDGGSPITSWTVQVCAADRNCAADSSDWIAAQTPAPLTRNDNSATLVGLTPGIGYRFRVAAVNANGTGASTASNVTVAGSAPDAPTSLTDSIADASAHLQWALPTFDGAAPITGWAVQVCPVDSGCSASSASWVNATTSVALTASSTDATITGLTNAHGYLARVAAINQLGTGSFATSAAFTPQATHFYVALGDGLSSDSAPALLPMLAHTDHPLALVQLSCSGETSDSFIAGGARWQNCLQSLSPDHRTQMEGYSNQLSAALAFINAHPGLVDYVTISIGGLDTAGNSGTNVTSIVQQLRAATGPNSKIVGQNFMDPFLAQWFNGSSGISSAQSSQTNIRNINTWLDGKFTAAGANGSADVGNAFSSFTPFTNVAPYSGQIVPVAVVALCTYTHNCDSTSPSPRLTDAGKTQMANAIKTKLDSLG